MTLIIETHPDPSAPFLFSKEERAEFERHGIKPFRHIIDDEYEKTDKLGTLTSITRVFDWRDDRDYLVFSQEFEIPGSKPLDVLFGGYNLPIIEGKTVLGFRPVFTVPATEKNIDVALSRMTEGTRLATARLSDSAQSLVGWKKVSKRFFVEGSE